jgi:prepilin-type N-terminal cleavage/methylation domain-containing protein
MKKQTQAGFTIVELLIVIVVIGILAAITIVAYNGIQQRAANNKTISAANTWVKALKLYKADNGRWPNGWVCLGENYPYGISGTDTSGTAQCRQTNATGYLVSASFNNLIRPYLNGQLPDPSFVTVINADSSQWRRGIHYAYGGGDGTQVYVDVAFAGVLSSCPVLQGVNGSRMQWGPDTYCNYTLGAITDS